jgi:hypothetical protein
MASKPYESLIYGQIKHKFAEKPAKGREIMREKTGKILPKVGTRYVYTQKSGDIGCKSI